MMWAGLDDVRLFFDVDGMSLVPDGPRLRERPTLVLLHGGPGFDHSPFKASLAGLAEVAQVVYLDLRGNGRSEAGDPEKLTLAQWGDDVVAFCETVGIERPIVLGASFGSFVALSYASRHPEHPARLILAACAARFRLDGVLPIFERLGGNEARSTAEAFWTDPSDEHFGEYMRRCLPLYNRSPLPEDVAQRVIVRRDVMNHFIRGEMRSFDLLPGLGAIRCPVPLLAGEDDPITPLSGAAEVREHLGGPCHMERFAGARHGLFVDAPESVGIIKDFIEAAQVE